jgi:hypothetical protein
VDLSNPLADDYQDGLWPPLPARARPPQLQGLLEELHVPDLPEPEITLSFVLKHLALGMLAHMKH